MSDSPVPVVDYTRYSNRQLVAVPLALFLVALLVITGTWATTGAPAYLGIDFTGGTEIQIETDASQDEIRAAFDAEVESITPIPAEDDQYLVEFQSTDVSEIESDAEAAGFGVISIAGTSATFGADTQVQALIGLLLAFLGMSVIVAALFRTLIPSVAVIASAASDLVIPLALMNLFEIQLTLGTVAALLMLIGYSVDSDLLLNTHVLRRRGDFYESVRRAMRTGVTMTTTAIIAMLVMTLVATYFGIPLLPEIGLVLVFGLLADLMNTYLLNVSLLRWYKFEGVNR
ncbi:protein translocase subunit SecF [Natronorarus salvus]|uniref:protein translocase subunit SecF n=1 Tax=Natronorarus salvus TaxID=3117733 RepID=UPI002F26C96B